MSEQLSISERVKRAVETGKWIIRADNDGVSPFYDAKGFKWSLLGEWTEAQDFNEKRKCGGGLHGQDRNYSGSIMGSRLVFCETEGEHIAIGDKVKVRRAAILLINQLPEGLTVGGGLDLRGTQIAALPEGLTVWGGLYLRGTKIAALPKGLTVGGGLDLSWTKIAALPEGLTVGGDLDLSGTQIAALPEGFTVGGDLDLSWTQIAALPKGLTVGGDLDLSGTPLERSQRAKKKARAS